MWVFQSKDHLLNVSFPYGTETVQFDSNGNPPGWYDIMNYQRHNKQQYGYVQIGSWRNGTLDMPDWPAKMVTSVCSEPCQRGQIKVGKHNNVYPILSKLSSSSILDMYDR
jgi:hypothetical protein